MVCLTHAGTIKAVDQIAEDHDIDVTYWSDDLLPYLQVKLHTCHFILYKHVTIRKELTWKE